MNGRVETVHRYSRAEIRGNPDKLFVFGDNLAGLGRGGQARECRGEPNAVGIVTKFHPTNDAAAFVYDHHLPNLRPIIQAQFRRLADHLRNGGTVVWPADGVGTGLARLNETGPAVAAFIERCRLHLERLASCDTRPKDGDPTGAPLASGAVGSEADETPK